MNLIRIKKELKRLWPKLKHIWPWDRDYHILTPDQLKEYSDIIRQAKIVFPDGTEVTFCELINSGDYWDCDNFSAGADFLMKLWGKTQSEKGEIPKKPVAYGRAMGTKFNGGHGFHALNYAITTDGVYFNDHDDGGKIWKADSKKDSVFFAFV